MRVSVNLASRPFVELRPLYARLRLAMAALGLLAIGLGFGLHALAIKARAAGAQMDALKSRTAAFERERSQNEARMRQPQNMGVLERSTFLNGLFARKSFSWTSVMMDLEHVVPSGIQVTSIDPVISKEGEVSIRLRIVGDRDLAIQLVRNLEKSQRFLTPRVAGESAVAADKAKALGQPFIQPPGLAPGMRPVNASGAELLSNAVEFEIFSGYNPLPPAPTHASRQRALGPDSDAPQPEERQPIVQHNRKPGAR